MYLHLNLSYIVISSSLLRHLFHSPWQMQSPLIYITNSAEKIVLFPHLTTHHILSNTFFSFIRQIIHLHFKGLPQFKLPYNLLHAIKMHHCSNTDARLGYHFKQSTFIIFSSCSSSAFMLRWNSFKQPQNHLSATHIMSTRKTFVAGSWLAEITTYHTGQQCLAVCFTSMYLS